MKKILFGASIFAMLVPVCASSQSVTTEDSAQSDAGKPYEIVITPTITRASLRELITKVEDDFFEKFNELNLDDAYDVLCYEFAPTGSHIRERVCDPYFFIQARSENAGAQAFSFGPCSTCKSTSPTIHLNRIGVRIEVGKEFEILQEKMEKLNRTNAEFNNIGSVLAQLKARLENFDKED